MKRIAVNYLQVVAVCPECLGTNLVHDSMIVTETQGSRHGIYVTKCKDCGCQIESTPYHLTWTNNTLDNATVRSISPKALG